ncbi:MAG: FxDxF family PEP-CTERM protein [Methylococcales bacterium]
MKNLYKSVVLSIALMAPIVSEAATYNISPDPITTSASFAAGPVNGVFSDTFNFNVVPNVGGSSSVTNIGFSLANGLITSFAAVIDGTINLVLSTTPTGTGAILSVLSQTFGTLSTGAHTLVVSGTAVNASYGGNININPVGAVPVPAAVWLFGSALVGLMGVSGRKKKTLS